MHVANEQTQEIERVFSNGKLEDQGHSNEKTSNEEDAPGTERQFSCSEIVVDMTAAGPNPKDSKTIWFETSFGLIGAHGSIRKELFISAVKQIEVGLLKMATDELCSEFNKQNFDG
jgi:hypothetical protein